MNIALLIALGFFLSQFYLWSSGLPQLSHIIIILAIIAYFTKSKKLKYSSALQALVIFSTYAYAVNMAFLIIEFGDTSYIVSLMYWIFNLMVFAVMTSLDDVSIQAFIRYLKFFIPLSLVLSILIWAIGGGRYDFAPRYNGFFNDPNQMAFWILSACAMSFIIFDKNYIKIIIYALSVFIILLTMSRSATIGLAVLTLGLILQQKGRIEQKIILVLLAACCVGIAGYILYKYGYLDNIITRFTEGVDEEDKQISDRGLDHLLNYPKYSILGAGQGGYSRFSETGHEVHSTWFGIAFYYGLTGLILFLYFLSKIFKRLSMAEKVILLGPMFYGFSTYNARTLAFWILIVVFYFAKEAKENKL